ncbi:hypothetical protein ACJIZ3_020592 [Penstemon smallii]|uniref:RING-type domain-containing protein n=1 Tax=Penstemon smallii TaxID=265156 RepID=A0ABD3SJX5_9LAMI
MAGMLPGVEAARRRRFHQSNMNYGSELSSSTRRSSFCLYASGFDYHLSSTSNSMRNPISQQAMYDESRLGTAAREAKRRLDERLWRSETKRSTSSQPRGPMIQEVIIQSTDHEVPNKLKRSGSKRLSWLKLNWKSSEQEECAVCLEQFKAEEGKTATMQLPCAHKFHTNCLVPWLEANGHCPCCRMKIPNSFLS